MGSTHVLRGENGRQVAVSQIFNIDNDSGATIDDAILIHSQPVKLLSIKALYTTATTGTVAAATVQLGTSVGGEEVVAVTALANTKAVGTTTALSIVSGAERLAAGTPLIVRHTGIAATAAGEYRVLVEYEVLND